MYKFMESLFKPKKCKNCDGMGFIISEATKLNIQRYETTCTTCWGSGVKK